MKLETFFEKFDQFADAPDAVEKMRELVLELAVKGALSERHASDQHDADWREFVTKLDQRSRDAVTDSEPPFEIPTAWRWACLDDLGTTRVRNDVEDSTRASFVPMALISSTYGVAAQSEERTWSEIKKGFTHFADGDVVMAKITPCFENAKSAVMRNLVNGVGAGTTELHVFRRGTELVLPDFVLLYVKTRGFITRGEPRMTGSAGQKRVPREYFATSPFPLPPLAEQKRIVAKVDELMALCDRLDAQQQERETRHAALARASLARFADAPTPANLPFLFHPSYAIPPADLRKSILTLAVQGKLVPQDANDEPAANFVHRLQRERRERFDAETMRARRDGNRPPKPPRNGFVPFVEEKDENLPNNWCATRVGDISDCLDYLRVPVNKGERLAAYGTVPYYGANGQVGWIDKHLFDEELVLVVEDETFIGRTKPFSYVIRGKSWVNNHAHVLRPLGGVTAGFLDLILCRYPFIPLTSGTTNRRKLTQPSLIDAQIALPPLAEQRRIVAKVEQLMALVDALETQLAASRATAANLLSALVAELTTGA